MESLEEEWNACAFHYKPCYLKKSQIYASHFGFEIENFDYCFSVKQHGVKINGVTVLQHMNICSINQQRNFNRLTHQI